ncbi:hypothetical protein A8B82_14820 [Sulfitobacter sp. EhC04]|uniref:hypothetical protein n=1 Tax=Sulfitobacter sp. EhC04 TaxID=1849168 RepID=UPI0007F42459|nr:hypothetical protein [Sulfitobacter sp. EhC04]OAN76669.1 hypothetical protein A8B82_14820 [Sulfitobacter sp. EhC04]
MSNAFDHDDRNQYPTSFRVSRRNFGHWDIITNEGRAFRIRGGPGSWRVIDERTLPGPDDLKFKEQAAAMAYICAELMHELLTVDGQQPHVMEAWNIDFTRERDPFGPQSS